MKTIKITSSLNLVIHLKIASGKIQKASLSSSENGFICQMSEENEKVFENVNSWLKAYLSKTSTPNIDLDFSSFKPFSKSVLEELSRVEFGKTLTYKQLAEKTHSPKAYRAVGTVCNINPFPLLIPCHRVLAKSSLGGFRYGLNIKKKILSFEGVSFS